MFGCRENRGKRKDNKLKINFESHVYLVLDFRGKRKRKKESFQESQTAVEP